MEKWKEYYTEEQIINVQKIELENFKVLTDVCEKLNVKFFAYGGTLIGAIRHKGFVPWDDDFDVAMPREDYERFIKEAPGILPEEYYLQNPYTDSKSPYFYTKLRLKGTKYIEYAGHKLDIEKGIYIDIYPIDNLPDEDKLFYKQYKKFRKLAVLFAWRQCPYLEQREKSLVVYTKRITKHLCSAVLNLIPREVFVNKLDKIAKEYNTRETSRKGNYHYPNPTNVFENLYPLEDGEFEGRSIKLPGGWHEHLTSRYGDYMEMPPEEKRIGHKPYLLDFGKYKI